MSGFPLEDSNTQRDARGRGERERCARRDREGAAMMVGALASRGTNKPAKFLPVRILALVAMHLPTFLGSPYEDLRRIQQPPPSESRRRILGYMPPLLRDGGRIMGSSAKLPAATRDIVGRSLPWGALGDGARRPMGISMLAGTGRREPGGRGAGGRGGAGDAGRSRSFAKRRGEGGPIGDIDDEILSMLAGMEDEAMDFGREITRARSRSRSRLKKEKAKGGGGGGGGRGESSKGGVGGSRTIARGMEDSGQAEKMRIKLEGILERGMEDGFGDDSVTSSLKGFAHRCIELSRRPQAGLIYSALSMDMLREVADSQGATAGGGLLKKLMEMSFEVSAELGSPRACLEAWTVCAASLRECNIGISVHAVNHLLTASANRRYRRQKEGDEGALENAERKLFGGEHSGLEVIDPADSVAGALRELAGLRGVSYRATVMRMMEEEGVEPNAQTFYALMKCIVSEVEARRAAKEEVEGGGEGEEGGWEEEGERLKVEMAGYWRIQSKEGGGNQAILEASAVRFLAVAAELGSEGVEDEVKGAVEVLGEWQEPHDDPRELDEELLDEASCDARDRERDGKMFRAIKGIAQQVCLSESKVKAVGNEPCV
jgi:hypothetical protein